MTIALITILAVVGVYIGHRITALEDAMDAVEQKWTEDTKDL